MESIQEINQIGAIAQKGQGEIVLYQPNDSIRLEVRMEDETVWLTQQQMAELFSVKEHTITYHIGEIYKTEELEKTATARKIRVVRLEGHRNVRRNIDFYNLDMIISVGYKVNSKRGIKFRQWASKVLKDYLIRGFSVNQRIERLEQRVTKTEEKIDFFVQTSLPPVQGIFFDGQIFDAYHFVSDLIRKAKQSIALVDNYIDDTVLTLIDKRDNGVTATIYTKQVTEQLRLDIDRHNAQYSPITIQQFNRAHDRFLLIDDEVYHIGASLKDLGKKWFAFTKMNDLTASELISKMQQI